MTDFEQEENTTLGPAKVGVYNQALAFLEAYAAQKGFELSTADIKNACSSNSATAGARSGEMQAKAPGLLRRCGLVKVDELCVEG